MLAVIGFDLFVLKVCLNGKSADLTNTPFCFQEHYQPDLEDMEELSDMRQDLMDRIQNIMNKSMEYRNSFDNYAYLWVDDRYSVICQYKSFLIVQWQINDAGLWYNGKVIVDLWILPPVVEIRKEFCSWQYLNLQPPGK